MPEEPSDDLAIWNRGMEKSIGSALPLRFVHVAKDRVVMTLEVDERSHQPMGVLHGGASVVLAETAASTGANLNCAEGMVALGQEINANHIRPMMAGTLTATAVPTHVGRTTQVWTIEMRDPAGKLVCVSRCTLAVTPIPPGLPTLRERGLMP
jgi:1,4-dihydroxy-2-naphthoyl-CoA hydrolase